jgi:hypothetical protein
MSLKFVKWDVNYKPVERSGDYLIKGIFEDDQGNKHEWFPKTEDLSEGIGHAKAAASINRLHRSR